MKLFTKTLIVLAATQLIFSATALAQSITVSDQTIRLMPPGQPVTAAFLTLTNNTDNAIAFTGAKSDVAAVVELHGHNNVNGVMKMYKVDEIEIPANGSAALAPGGFHIMLIDLPEDLSEGDEVVIELSFSNGETLETVAPVERIMPNREKMEHGMKDMMDDGKSMMEGMMKKMPMGSDTSN